MLKMLAPLQYRGASAVGSSATQFASFHCGGGGPDFTMARTQDVVPTPALRTAGVENQCMGTSGIRMRSDPEQSLTLADPRRNGGVPLRFPPAWQ
ncbi:MAG: hypothetical protein HUU46_13635 [Candidatus Hydrogenedentes bacterium]|nr:hypothetical protein [Candidatus Hydrogenedentota bacterium]